MKNQNDYHYIPPDDEIIDKYSKQVCSAMDETDNLDIVHGFAGFIGSITRAYANLLNQTNSQENDDGT